MVSRAEIDRLRLEADTIMTRYQRVEAALDRARSEPGEHWERGELPLTLETPRGEQIEVTLDFERDPTGNVEARYERAKELEAELERRQQVVGQLCEEMETAGVLERVESGTVKQRRVKAKQADEVRQHHTYYVTTDGGAAVLRELEG
jgi:predicted ribosome quality control (RQC) complex YloA/Tae2 family protein